MLCWRYRKLLIGYAECELDERRRARIEAHVSRCPRCSQELTAIRSVSSAIKSAETPAMAPAPDLWARVSARIERESLHPAHGKWIRVTQAASACAAAVLVAVVGVGLMRTELPRENSRAPRKLSGPPPATAKLASRLAMEKPRETVSAKPAGTRKPKRWFADAGKATSHPGAGVRRRAEPKDSVAAVAKWDRPSPAIHLATTDTAGSPAVSTPVAARTEMAPVAPSGELALDSAFAMKSPSATPAAEAGDRAKTSHYLRDSPDAAKAPPLDADVKAGAEGVALGFRDEAAGDRYAVTVRDVAGPGARASEKESVVDALNKTEGVRTAALFSYP